jgi:hypothetical protein
MRWPRQYHFVWFFLVMLAFCSVMVVRQFNANQSRHVELREAFILLHTRGYTNEAQRLFQHLLKDVEHGLSDQALIDDFQRTLILIDPAAKRPRNLIYDYHWTVSNELEKRSVRVLQRALKLAHEEP